jgi:serine phosphatase RsbU (regulator of sigma subunit)
MLKNNREKSFLRSLIGHTALAVYLRLGLLAVFILLWYFGNQYLNSLKGEMLKPRTVVFQLPFPESIEGRLEITRDVDYAEYTIDSVYLSGFFCDWDARSPKHKMTQVSSNRWEGQIPVDFGDNQYKFVVYFTSDSPQSQVWSYDVNAPVNVDDEFGGMNSIISIFNVDEFLFLFNFIVLGFIAVILIYTVLQPLLIVVLRLRLSFGLKLIIMVFLVALLSNTVLIYYNLRQKTDQMKYWMRESINMIHLILLGEKVDFNKLDQPETIVRINTAIGKTFWFAKARVEKDKVSSSQLMLQNIMILDTNFNYIFGSARKESDGIIVAQIAQGVASNFQDWMYRYNFGFLIDYAKANPLEAQKGIFLAIPIPGDEYFQPLLNLGLFGYDYMLYPIVVDNEIKGYYTGGFYPVIINDEMQKNLYSNLLLLAISMLFFMILSLNIGGFISKYLNQLIEWTKHIIHGNFDVEKKIETHDEIEVLAKNFDVLRLTVGSNLRDLKLINEVTAVLNTINQIDELYAVFLYFITANFGLGYNRAAIFLIDNDALVGHYAIGMLDSGEVDKTFGSMDNYRDFKIEMQEFIANYKEYISQTESEFYRRMRELRIPKSEPSILWTIIQRNCFLYVSHTNGQEFETDRRIRDSLNLQDYLLMPIFKGQEVIGVLLADNIFQTRTIKDHDINQLQILLNDFAANLENTYTILNLEKLVLDRTAELHQINVDLKQKDRVISTDLKIAKRIQQSLLPKKTDRIGDLGIDTRYMPMAEVGGDYFDITGIADGLYRVFIADATGHGVQAALITLLIKGEYDRLKMVIDNPGELVELINNGFMLDSRHLSFFFTCVVADINLKENKVSYASAGHPTQYIFSGDSIISMLPTGKVAGIIEGTPYKSVECEFKPGDKMVLFSDGLFEEFNSRGEELGEERMGRILYEFRHKTPVELNDSAIDEMNRFIGGMEINDDLTMLCISFDKKIS